MSQHNFGRNVQLMPSAAFAPRSEQEVLDILNQHRGRRLRVIGRLHSWSKIIETDDVLLDLRHLNQVETGVDGSDEWVHVGAGCQIKRLLSELRRQQSWTLPSIGLITEQAVAGAISTGTHGSGRNSLSHYVTGLRIARFDPQTGQAIIEEITELTELRAARCSLGCMGVILSVRMGCRALYDVEEHFHEYKQLQDVVASEDQFPLQQFYLLPWRWSYFAQHRREVNGRRSTCAWLYRCYRFLIFDVAMHLLILSTIRLFPIRGLVRAMFRWLIPAAVIRNCRVVDTAEAQLVMQHEMFRHIEIELFVRNTQLDSAMAFVQQTLSVAGGTVEEVDEQFTTRIEQAGLRQEFGQLAGVYCHHYPICVRKVLNDDTLISMASPGAESQETPATSAWYAISLICYARGTDRDAFELLAGFLARSMAHLFGARPHWGKLCPLSTDVLRTLYPRFAEFRAACITADHDGVFRNEWTDQLLAAASVDETNRLNNAESEPE